MNENQIDTFLAVVQQGSFSRASEILHISQPAVTYRIRMLEEELGAKLFDSGVFNAKLTAAGHVFYEEAQRLSEALYQTRQRMLRFAPQDVLILGFPERMLSDNHAFLQIMDRCTRLLGGGDGTLVQSKKLDHAPLHVRQLLRGEVDLVFADLEIEELRGEQFERRRLFDDKARVCMHKKHPLAGRKSLRISDLRKESICLYEDSSSFPMRIGQVLTEKGITMEAKSAPSFVQLLPRLLMGDVISISDQRPISHEELVYVPLDMERSIDVGIAWLKERTTPRLRQAVHIIESMPWDVWLAEDN